MHHRAKIALHELGELIERRLQVVRAGGVDAVFLADFQDNLQIYFHVARSQTVRGRCMRRKSCGVLGASASMA